MKNVSANSPDTIYYKNIVKIEFDSLQVMQTEFFQKTTGADTYVNWQK